MAVLDDLLDGADRQAVARGGLAVDTDVQVLAAGHRFGIDVAGAVHASYDVGHLSAEALERGEIAPKIFTPTSDRMPVVSMSIRLMIGIVQMFATPGSCTARPISARSRSSVMPGTPLIARLQVDHGLGHVERRRVGGRVRARHLGDRVLDFREASSVLRSAAAAIRVFSSSETAGIGDRHEHQVAFVQRRHELAADARGQGERADEQQRRSANRDQRDAESADSSTAR